MELCHGAVITGGLGGRIGLESLVVVGDGTLEIFVIEIVVTALYGVALGLVAHVGLAAAGKGGERRRQNKRHYICLP